MMFRRGWRNESVRHSLAARGIRTNYFFIPKKMNNKKVLYSVGSQRFSDDVHQPIVLEIQDLTDDIITSRKVMKLIKANKNKDLPKEDREELRALREQYRANIKLMKDKRAEKRRELNSLLNTVIPRSALEKGDPAAIRLAQEKTVERVLDSDLDRFMRAERMARESNVRDAVKELGVSEEKSFLPGLPSDAKITVAPTRKKISTNESRKRKVVISGQQGSRAVPESDDFPTVVESKPFFNVDTGRYEKPFRDRVQGRLAERELAFLTREDGYKSPKVKVVTDTSSPDLTVTLDGKRPFVDDNVRPVDLSPRKPMVLPKGLRKERVEVVDNGD